MTLVLAIVVIAVIASRPTVRRAMPSESLVTFLLSAAALVALFELDRLG